MGAKFLITFVRFWKDRLEITLSHIFSETLEITVFLPTILAKMVATYFAEALLVAFVHQKSTTTARYNARKIKAQFLPFID